MEQRDPPVLETRTYQTLRVLGKGSFGVVYQARVIETGEIVAIKSTRVKAQSPTAYTADNGNKEREVQILKELRGHPNIVSLKGAFLTETDRAEPKMVMVLEFLSDTLHRVLKHYNKIKRLMEHSYVRIYTYQLLRGLGYFHGKGIVHADLKPQNLLLDGGSCTLKICDFGTSKRLILGHTSLAYCCSRYYRAPELILGNHSYSLAVDLWSVGCIFAEMIIGQPLFCGNDGIDQLVEIIKVLGTPTREDLQAMNPSYHAGVEFSPKVAPRPLDQVCRKFPPEDALELLGSLLRYNPSSRTPPLLALLHRYFDSMRDRPTPANMTGVSDGTFYDFLPDELLWCTQQQREKLVPRWYQTKRRRTGDA